MITTVGADASIAHQIARRLQERGQRILKAIGYRPPGITNEAAPSIGEVLAPLLPQTEEESHHDR